MSYHHLATDERNVIWQMRQGDHDAREDYLRNDRKLPKWTYSR